MSQQTGRYRFFVDGKEYKTAYRFLNSMEIKSVAGVPLNHRLAHNLVRRFVAGEQKLFLSDADPIDLDGEPKEFDSVPNATW